MNLVKLLANKIVFKKDEAIRHFNNLICKLMKSPEIISMTDTINAIIERRASISRFGDGEFDIIFGRYQPFQSYNKQLRLRLQQVLKANNMSDRLLVAIPDCYGDLSHFTPEAQNHWKIRLDKERLKWYRILNRKHPYYQAQISRFYFDWADKSRSPIWAEKLKKIWEQRNILIVEGDKSRMGVGNDLFEGAASIRRILCPAVNAFSKYDEIVSTIQAYASSDDLILMALGPTASILAYDLYKKGYQAVDIGHIDIEYEWMKMGATTKERIPGRFMNEIDQGAFVNENFDNKAYKNQIIAMIE